MWVSLPPAVGRICELCARGDHRFGGTLGIKVTDDQFGRFKLEATDGRFLGIVQGNILPPLPEIQEDMVNACFSVIVPAKDWKEIFADKRDNADRILIWSDGNWVTLHRYFKGTLIKSLHCKSIEERFPPTAQVIPCLGPKIEMTLDANKLAEFIKTAASFTRTDGMAVLRMGFYPTANSSEGMLLGFSGRTADPELTFDGLLVPLATATPEAKEEPEPTNGQAPHEEDSEEEQVETPEQA